MEQVSWPLLVAAAIQIAAISLHIYTFEVWIWPKLDVKGFPSFPFGPPKVVMGFYRTVWHFFTVNLLVTIVTCIAVAFGYLIPYGILLIQFLMVFWILIVVEIFVVGALSLEPGDSYIKTMLKAFQWVFVLLFVFFMYWGTRPTL
jgi:FtsH-binding integral membrane protein